MKFLGRQKELIKLREFQAKRSASLIVMRGRRRIGKSRLLEEFGKDFSQAYYFSGLPPEEKTTTRHQLEEFSRQMARAFRTAPAIYMDWSDAFWALGEKLQKGKSLLVFDEISWMGSKDATFLGKIKNLWDLYLKKNDNLVFIICGSASSWIEKNILQSTGFVGRVSYTMALQELTLPECSLFWPQSIDAYEKLKFLSITGGVPKYLEEMNPNISAEENIKRLCFTPGGFLVDEFERIFADIFLRNSDMYKQILHVLAAKALEQRTVFETIEGYHSGRISEYLKELELAGFIRRDFTWNFSQGQDNKISQYRLQDNYLRFYLKVIEPHMSMIQRGAFQYKSLALLPGFSSILGLQFENLVLNSRPVIHNLLELDDVVNENPYFQRKTKRQEACQIDYLIQTRSHSLYVCEIKFSKNPIGSEVIQEVQEKITRLKIPRGFSIRPVLIHVNGCQDSIKESEYFSHVISFGDLLKQP